MFSQVDPDRRIYWSQPWPKFDWSVPSQNVAIFGQVSSGQNLVVLGKINPGRNLVESSQVNLEWNFLKSTSAQIRSKVIQVHPILKFDLVGLDKKFAKFYGVSLMDTSLKKNNLNLFYEKWILDFELDPNI